MVVQIFDSEKKKQIAEEILRQLPDWFGIPESTKCYVAGSAGMPFWAWCESGEETAGAGMTLGNAEAAGCADAKCAGNCEFSGFLSLKETSPDTAEIFVMGVLQGRHRRGIGRELFLAFEQYAREGGYSFVQVKTVQNGHYEVYDRTNAFYRAMGFRELECLPTLWDEKNPCQIYVKYIGNGH